MALKKEANGTWTFYGRMPKNVVNPLGKSTYKQRGFKTKREAMEAEVEFKKELRGEISTSKIRMKELINLYMEDSPLKLKESTLKGYERIQNEFILPSFSDTYIDEITTFQLQRWINDIFKNGRNGQKYANATIKSILLHMSGLMKYAQRHNWISNNPVSGVDCPKDPNMKANEKTSIDNYWEIDEFNKFLDRVEDGYHYDLYEFAFNTGLRIGEICALQWKHIDFQNETVKVEQTLSSNTCKITSPKTVNSNRTIKVAKKIISKFKTRYNYLKRLKNFNDEWFLFGDENYMSISTARRWFNDDVKKAGVKKITFHGLRHSSASYLLSNQELSEQLIAERLGHTVKTMRETYFHVYKKCRNELDDFVDSM